MSAFELKIGDTFHFPLARVLQDDGVTPEDLTGVTILSQVRDIHNTVVATCSIQVISAAQGTIRMLGIDTTAWPLKELFWDIQVTKAGIVTSSKTVAFKMVRDISR